MGLKHSQEKLLDASRSLSLRKRRSSTSLVYLLVAKRRSMFLDTYHQSLTPCSVTPHTGIPALSCTPWRKDNDIVTHSFIIRTFEEVPSCPIEQTHEPVSEVPGHSDLRYTFGLGLNRSKYEQLLADVTRTWKSASCTSANYHNTSLAISHQSIEDVKVGSSTHCSSPTSTLTYTQGTLGLILYAFKLKVQVLSEFSPI